MYIQFGLGFPGHWKGQHMTSTQAPVMGLVSGFLLIIDLENLRDKYERVVFSDTLGIAARVKQIEAADLQTSTDYFTLIRREDTGEVEEYEGIDFSGKTEVGECRVKLFCKCGKSEWFQNHKYAPASRTFECEECGGIDGPHDDRLETIRFSDQ